MRYFLHTDLLSDLQRNCKDNDSRYLQFTMVSYLQTDLFQPEVIGEETVQLGMKA